METVSALARLLRRSQLASPDQLADIVIDAAAQLGAGGADVFLVDYSQRQLRHLPPTGGEAILPLDVEGSLCGRAFRRVEVLSATYEDEWRLLLPILDSVERLGVLRLSFPPAVEDSAELRERSVELAALLGELLPAKGQYGDSLQRVARTETMAMAAEMQWQLLPPLTFGTERVVITGRVEPCYAVGGDIFDYAVDGDTARFAIFDAMGHGLGAGVLAAVTIAAYRNGRRSNLDLTATVLSIDAVMAEEFGPDKFVTGVLGELDLGSGRFRRVNCGHPSPLLVRGQRTLVPLTCPPALPLGLGITEVNVCEEWLEPGDRLLLYSDGVVEARNSGGEFFGVERLAHFIIRESASGEAAPEVMRRLTQALLTHQSGQLQDDASNLLVEWKTHRELRLLP